jgi:hypothetical protein
MLAAINLKPPPIGLIRMAGVPFKIISEVGNCLVPSLFFKRETKILSNVPSYIERVTTNPALQQKMTVK